MRKGWLVIVLAGLLVSLFGQESLRTLTPNYAPGQLIVQFRPELTPGERAMLRTLVNAQLFGYNDWLDFEYWQVSPYADVPALCAQLKRTGWV